jgi:hypothetical protein
MHVAENPVDQVAIVWRLLEFDKGILHVGDQLAGLFAISLFLRIHTHLLAGASAQNPLDDGQ